MVIANHWLRSIETYMFLCWLAPIVLQATQAKWILWNLRIPILQCCFYRLYAFWSNLLKQLKIYCSSSIFSGIVPFFLLSSLCKLSLKPLFLNCAQCLLWTQVTVTEKHWGPIACLHLHPSPFLKDRQDKPPRRLPTINFTP